MAMPCDLATWTLNRGDSMEIPWKFHAHRIHGAGIYTNIGGILMVNVTIYSIHGSYGMAIRCHIPWTF